MKTIEEMAHDYLCAEIAHSGMNMINEHDAVRMAFLFAKAMQAEAEKRKTTPNADPMCKVREAEWQPDWSQAPEWANWWVKTPSGETMWCAREPVMLDDYARLFSCSPAPSFNYQGDWKDSLRKRP